MKVGHHSIIVLKEALQHVPGNLTCCMKGSSMRFSYVQKIFNALTLNGIQLVGTFERRRCSIDVRVFGVVLPRIFVNEAVNDSDKYECVGSFKKRTDQF
jgi:hypothetical protein